MASANYHLTSSIPKQMSMRRRNEKKLHGVLREVDKNWQGKGSNSLQLMFQDEARFGRITDPRRCWAPFPMRPICKAMVTREYTYAYAAVNVETGALDTLIFPYANTECMQKFLDEVAARHSGHRIVMVMDGAGWHRSKTLIAPENMVLIKLPPYSPELNPVENLWNELREKSFDNIVFSSLKTLEIHLEESLINFEMQHDKIKSIVACPWIINSLIN